MTDSAIEIPSGAGHLAATLLRPHSADGPTASDRKPVALILGGSGPLDRDGNVKKMKLNISRELAEILNEHLWTSLRYDKRGVGQSPGDYYATGFFDELADAQAALDWIRPEGQHRGLGRGRPIVIIGHSAGAVQAGQLAAANTDVAAVILLSTSTKTGEETLRWQAKEIVANSIPSTLQPILGRVSGWQQNLALRMIRRSKRNSLNLGFTHVNVKWFREFMAYDPTVGLRGISCLVCALTGDKDIQVDPHDLSELRKIVPNSLTKIEPNVDHLLRSQPAKSSPKKYKEQVKLNVDAGVIAQLREWLAQIDGTGTTRRD